MEKKSKVDLIFTFRDEDMDAVHRSAFKLVIEHLLMCWKVDSLISLPHKLLHINTKKLTC